MSLDNLLGVYYIEDYYYWIALFLAIILNIYLGNPEAEKDKIQYSVPERIFHFSAMSIFLSFFTFFGITILLAIFSNPVNYLQRDLLGYETQNEINKKWALSGKALEEWCMGEKPYSDNTNLRVCLTQKDYRLSKLDKLVSDQYQVHLEDLDWQKKNYNNIPKKIKKYASIIGDNDTKISIGYFYLDSNDDEYTGYVFDTYDEYVSIGGSYVPQGELAKDDFLGCTIVAEDEDNKSCFKLNYITDNQTLFYLNKYCALFGCNMRINYISKNNFQYVTSFEILEPRLKDYEEKSYIKKEYFSKLEDAERKTKESITYLSSGYNQPEIISDIALSLNELD